MSGKEGVYIVSLICGKPTRTISSHKDGVEIFLSTGKSPYNIENLNSLSKRLRDRGFAFGQSGKCEHWNHLKVFINRGMGNTSIRKNYRRMLVLYHLSFTEYVPTMAKLNLSGGRTRITATARLFMRGCTGYDGFVIGIVAG
jgi:hypothetical protein